jgi:pilus assembly protein CpaE
MRTLVVSSSNFDPISTRLKGVLRTKVDADGPVLARYEDVEKGLTQVEAEMAVIALSPDPERGLVALRYLRQATSGYVLAVGQASEPKLILKALDHGADHYLDEAELESGIESVLLRLKHKRQAAPPSGRLLAVLGASGGSGASTLAVNMATVLCRDQCQCVLLDLKPGRGDLSALLDLKPAFHLADLCLNASRLDQAMFEKALVAHPCGVQLLASPQTFGDTRLVTAQGVQQVLTLARQLFSHVVADLEDCFHEEQLLTLHRASAIVLVSRLDFTSLRNVRRILDHLEENGISRETVRIAVNRHGQPGELPATEAEEALGGKLSYFIPDDPKTINGANNTGVPVVLRTPSAKVSSAISQMVWGILDRRRVEPVAARTSWF